MQWIKKSKKYPPEHQSVLLFVRAQTQSLNFTGTQLWPIDLCAIGWHSERVWNTTLDEQRGLYNLEITHWMPLPEKPKEFKNEKNIFV